MLCVLFCLPFRHLFREPFAMWRFSFAAIHFRGLSWKILKEFPMFPGKHILKHLFPACHAKVSKFYQSCMPPIASSSSSSSFTSSSSTPPSTASQISVGTAGLQPRAPDFSGHYRAPTATASSQWVQPDTASARSQWALPLSIEWGGRPLSIFLRKSMHR